MSGVRKICPLRYGPLTFSTPIIEAALSGYSDAPMRRLARRFGCEFTLAEVMLDRFVMEVSRRSKSRLYLAVTDEDRPCGAQLMGSDSVEFVAAAKQLVACGFDAIDLNFACPVKKVLGRSRGGALLKNPSAALEIVSRVREVLPHSIPLSVKLRKGFDDSPESAVRFFSILDGLLERGVAGITLHGRTVRQGYTGTADWGFVRHIKESILRGKNRPDFFVIGSGDLFSAEISLRRWNETGVDGIALARGIIGNPWLFREVGSALRGEPIPPPPTLAEQRETIAEHWRGNFELYGAKRGASLMRKFLIRYAERHPDPERVRNAFVRFNGEDELNRIFREYY